MTNSMSGEQLRFSAKTVPHTLIATELKSATVVSLKIGIKSGIQSEVSY